MSKSTEKTVAQPKAPRSGQATKPDAVAAKPVYSFDFKITSDEQHAAAIEQLIAWEQAPDAADNKALALLADAVEAYETAQGHTPEPPVTLRGILEVEMFKRRIRQRALAEILEVSEPRLSELMQGKRELNMDFARRLYTRLKIPADVIFSIAR